MTDREALKTDIALHRAAQYLSTFGKNFIKEESDDSHSNMEWNTEGHSFRSHITTEGRQLILDCENFELRWEGGRELQLSLSGRSHSEVIVWMHHCALQNNLDDYEFQLNYRLDSGSIDHDMVYPDVDKKRLDQLNSYRDIALQACNSAKEYFDFNTEIRVWPHHFDTGGYHQHGDIGIGFGMAIPDDMIGDYYLYVSAYKGHDGVDTAAFPALTNGEWRNENFKGATLAVSDLKPDDWVSFFKEAIQAYMGL